MPHRSRGAQLPSRPRVHGGRRTSVVGRPRGLGGGGARGRLRSDGGSMRLRGSMRVAGGTLRWRVDMSLFPVSASQSVLLSILALTGCAASHAPGLVASADGGASQADAHDSDVDTGGDPCEPPRPGACEGVTGYGDCCAELAASCDEPIVGLEMTRLEPGAYSYLPEVLFGQLFDVSVSGDRLMFQIDRAANVGRVGLTRRSDDGTTRRFYRGDAPPPFAPSALDPSERPLVMNTVRDRWFGLADPIGPLWLVTVIGTLPIRALELHSARLADGDSCIGSADPATPAGDMTIFVMVDDTMALILPDVETTVALVPEFIGRPLCDPLAGLGPSDSCSSVSRERWPYPPTARCDGSNCVQEIPCVGAECNAWGMRLAFTARAVPTL